MEARPEPSAPAWPPLAPDDLRATLAFLGSALRKPLEALRLGDGQGEADELMGVLCDDLEALTRDYFDYAAILANSIRPQPVETTLAEMVRAGGDPAWTCRLQGPDATVETDPAWAARLVRLLAELAIARAPEGFRPEVIVAHDPARSTWSIRTTGPPLPWTGPPEPFSLDRRDEPGESRLGTALPLLDAMLGPLGGDLDLQAGAIHRLVFPERVKPEGPGSPSPAPPR